MEVWWFTVQQACRNLGNIHEWQRQRTRKAQGEQTVSSQSLQFEFQISKFVFGRTKQTHCFARGAVEDLFLQRPSRKPRFLSPEFSKHQTALSLYCAFTLWLILSIIHEIRNPSSWYNCYCSYHHCLGGCVRVKDCRCFIYRGILFLDSFLQLWSSPLASPKTLLYTTDLVKLEVDLYWNPLIDPATFTSVPFGVPNTIQPK